MSLYDDIKKLDKLYKECRRQTSNSEEKNCSEFRDFTYRLIIKSNKKIKTKLQI